MSASRKKIRDELQMDTMGAPGLVDTRGSVVRHVKLVGKVGMMLNRYAGDNKTQLAPADKFYFDVDGKSLVYPALNIKAMLSSQNMPSAPRRFLGKQAIKVCQACLSFVDVSPELIPITRNGKQIVFGGFNQAGLDPTTGIRIHYSVARLKGGIPNPQARPLIPTPWEVEFDLRIIDNDEVQESTIKDLIIRSGDALGLGTYRGVFGKYYVEMWE